MSPSENSLLWRLRMRQNDSDSYLLGTMHSSSADALSLFLKYIPIIQSCRFYYAETNLDSAIFDQVRNVQLNGWGGYRDILSNKSLAKASRIIRTHHGLDIHTIEHLPPLMISAIISDALLQRGTGATETLDVKLWHTAKSYGMILEGIESPLDQFNTFNKIPIAYQKKQLKDLMTNLRKSTSQIKALSNAYKNNDLNKLFHLSKKSLGAVRKILLYDRNLKMSSHIIEILNKQSCNFVAVGAAHLPGSKGILRLLKQSGVDLVPMQ